MRRQYQSGENVRLLFLGRAAFADDQRPKIELEPTGHPLAVHQRDGIPLEKAWEIAHFYLAEDE